MRRIPGESERDYLSRLADAHLEPETAQRWLALLRPAIRLAAAGDGGPVVARLGADKPALGPRRTRSPNWASELAINGTTGHCRFAGDSSHGFLDESSDPVLGGAPSPAVPNAYE